MPHIKHIFKYSAFILIATIFSLFASLSWIENIGFIFAIPSSSIIPLFSWIYGVCAGPLYAIIFFRAATLAPKNTLLTSLGILLLSMLVLSIILGSSLLDLIFISAICLAATGIAIAFKKYKEKRNTSITAEQPVDHEKTNTPFYFPLTTFGLCLLYFLTFGLFKYYWWHKNWQFIKQRDHKHFSPVFRSIFAVFFYESFLDDINKTNQLHKIRGIKYTSLLTSYYILLVIGTIFITVLSAAYNTLGLQLHYSFSSLTSTFSIVIFTLAIFLYAAPQLAINRLNHKYHLHARKSMAAVIFIYALISTTIWFPACAKWVSIYRTDTRNAFILYDYGHYQAAYKIAINQAYEDDAEAKLLIGQMYLHGNGVMQDKGQALSWLEDAAASGNVEAQYLTGLLYRNGVNDNLPDYKKSAMWYQKAADHGNAYAANDLATLYSSGLGVERNRIKAFALYQQAAAKGDGYAMYNLGLHYEREVSPPNYHLAAEWYKKSIETTPNACAYHDLGTLYVTGKGVTQDTDQAKNLLEKAGRELLADYLPEITNETALTEKETADELISAFVQYQYAQAAQQKTTDALTKNYSPATIKATNIMSKKIKAVCWD